MEWSALLELVSGRDESKALSKISHKTAHYELIDMVARGLILTKGSGRSTCYELNTDGSKQPDFGFQESNESTIIQFQH